MNVKFKIYRYLAFLILLSACKNEYEPIFNESPDERVRKVIEDYRNTLINAPNGYKAIIYTGSGGGYMYYLDFQENGTVTMVSDFSLETSATPMNGTFVIKALQRPTLSFDTYSYIHLLADPSEEVNGGENGVGLESDVEFAFEKFSGDTIDVEGTQRNTEMILIEATQQEASAFLAGKLNDNITNTTTFLDANPYPYLEFSGGTQIAVDINQENKTITLFYKASDNSIQQTTLPFSYSTNGILLKEPVQYGNASIQELIWDDNQQSFYVMQGNQKIYMQSSVVPVIPLVYALGYLHNAIVVDPAVITNLPAEFMTIYNQAKDELILVGGYNLVLDGFALSFDQSNTAAIIYFIHNNTGDYQASYFYNKNISGNGLMTFTLTGQDANASVIALGLSPLLDYFANNAFAFNYEVAGEVLAKVTPQQTPAAFFLGELE
jgi:hypothetical protein